MMVAHKLILSTFIVATGRQVEFMYTLPLLYPRAYKVVHSKLFTFGNYSITLTKYKRQSKALEADSRMRSNESDRKN